MKLSGHNYSNEVFNSLLDGIQKNIVLNIPKKAQKSPDVDLNFTSVTQETYDNVISDEMRFIASELLYASKIANVEIDEKDLMKFAQQIKKDKIRGKKLERAARKYCNELSKISSKPVGHTNLSTTDLLKASKSAVISASYSPESVNESKPCGYMGMSKNPNTIWDSEALQRMASKTDDRTQMYGDEQISHSRKANEDFKNQLKKDKLAESKLIADDSNNIRNKISNISTQEAESFNPNLRGMSMFSNDRDFSDIPEKTAGEMLKEQSKQRQEKSIQSKAETNKLSSSKKADNNANFLFAEQEKSQKVNTSSQRKSIDRLFEGLLSVIDNKNNQ